MWLRPERAAPRALAIAGGVVGGGLVLALDFLVEYRFVPVFRFVEAVGPAAVLNLGLVFPRRRMSDRARWSVVLLLAVVLLTVQFGFARAFMDEPERARRAVVGLYLVAAAGTLVLLYNYAETLLRPKSSEERTQAAAVCAGGLPAFGMAAFGILAFTLFGWSFSWSWVFALLPLATLSMVYAMLARDLFDAERVVRLGAGYGLATASVIFVYALGLYGLDRFLAAGASGNPAAGFLLLLVIVLGFEPLRRRIQAAVDRAFYRSPLSFSEPLSRMSGDVQDLTTEEEISRYVSERICEALQLEFAQVVLGTTAAVPGAALQQELSFRGERLGIVACGAKLSGSPFAAEERLLIEALADQAALAIHHARTAQALRVKERLAAVGEFAGAVAHGIRNPLSGIRAGVDVASGLNEVEAIHATLAQVSSEAQRLENRIRSLLNLSRPYEPVLSDSEVGGVLRRVGTVIRASAERAGVDVETRLPQEPVTWPLDSDAFSEALLELAKNGVEAAAPGGSLSISLEAPTAGGFTVYVSDTGPGIPRDHADRVFDLFYTTRHEGTGIGLASAKKIIEALGGSLALDSTADRGSGATFRIRFARHQPDGQ